MFFWSMLCFFFVIRLWLSCFGGIHPDEAYYWVWSLKPQWGYFDHPPMVAWLIWLSRKVVELMIPNVLWERDPRFYAQLGLRFVPFFFSSVLTPYLVGKAVELLQQKPLRVLQMWVLVSSPLFLFGPQVITPDCPLFFFWTLSLLIGLHFLKDKDFSQGLGVETPFNPKRAVFMGVCLGLALYSKYTAMLACFIFAVTMSGLANGIVTAVTVAVVLVPQIIWNLQVGQTEGAGLFFQMNNGLGGTLQIRPVYKWAGDLWATQFLFWSPLVFIFSLLLPLRNFRKMFAPRQLRLFTGTLFVWAFAPLVFFSITTLQRRAEGNWPIIGAVAAFALVLTRLQRRPVWLFWIITFNLLTMGMGYTVLVHGPSMARLAGIISPRLEAMANKPSRLEEFSDWQNLHELVFETVRFDNDPVLVRTYQLTSILLFEDAAVSSEERLGSRIKIWAAHSRKSQFHIDPAYLPPEKMTSHWIVTKLPNVENDIPATCKQETIIEKGQSGKFQYGVYKCQ